MALTEQVNDCPFCHGRARVQLFDRMGYAAVCSGCAASGPERPSYLGAVNAWNDYANKESTMRRMQTYRDLF